MQNFSSKIRQIDWKIGYATKMSDGLQILKGQESVEKTMQNSRVSSHNFEKN